MRPQKAKRNSEPGFVCGHWPVICLPLGVRLLLSRLVRLVLLPRITLVQLTGALPGCEAAEEKKENWQIYTHVKPCSLGV